MDGDGHSFAIETSIAGFEADDWDSLAGKANPFVSHSFLSALERGGAVGGESGWEPMHVVIRDGEGRMVAAMPHYAKHHSYGEYVFDHAWADAYMRAGGRYYPKLLGAVPFTPATGPRLLTGSAGPLHADQLRRTLATCLKRLLQKLELSSVHVNFLPREEADSLERDGWLVRSSIQYHWMNDGYADFEEFLAGLSSSKRKNIRKERRAVERAGVRLLRLVGDDITADHIDDFYRFYRHTSDRKWGEAYITRESFHHMRASMSERMLLVMAELDGTIIGGALNFVGEDTLYGRNWGADIEVPFLHFEACYYQAIDFAIANRLARVEAGAQGFHKVQRGYMPTATWSAHWIAHDGFRRAVEQFLKAEREGIDAEMSAIELHRSPFRKGTKRNR